MRNLVAILLLIVSQASAFAEQPYVISSMTTTELVETCRRAGEHTAGGLRGLYLGSFLSDVAFTVDLPSRQSYWR